MQLVARLAVRLRACTIRVVLHRDHQQFSCNAVECLRNRNEVGWVGGWRRVAKASRAAVRRASRDVGEKKYHRHPLRERHLGLHKRNTIMVTNDIFLRR